MNIDDELRRLFSDDRLDLPIRAGAASDVVAGARRIRRRRTVVTAAAGAATVVALFAVAASLPGLGGAEQAPGAGPEVAAETTASTVPSAPSISTGSGTAVVPSEPAAPNGEPKPGRGTTRRNPPASGGSTSSAPKVPPALAIGPIGYLGLRLGMNAETAEATGLLVAEQPPAQGCPGYDYRTQPISGDQPAVRISASSGIASITGRPDAVTPEGIKTGSTEADVKRVYPAAVQVSGTWYASAGSTPPAQYAFVMKNQAVAAIQLELKTHDC